MSNKPSIDKSVVAMQQTLDELAPKLNDEEKEHANNLIEVWKALDVNLSQDQDLATLKNSKASLLLTSPPMIEPAFSLLGLSQEDGTLAYLRKLKEESRFVPTGLTTILNPYLIKTGDLLFITPKNPENLSAIDKLKYDQTFETQLKLLGDEESAKYTHMAISRRGHEIYESVPSPGVRFSEKEAWKYMDDSKYTLKVMRHKTLDQGDRTQPVFNIAELVGKGYGFASLALIRAEAEQLPWVARALSWAFDEDKSYICSALYAAACEREFIDLKLRASSTATTTPAHLLLSDELEDVTDQIGRVALPALD